MTAEEWRAVVGYEGLYAVSSVGRVKSLERLAPRSRGGPTPVRERVIRPATAKRGGYHVVVLHSRGNRKLRSIHSLVAEAFIGPRPRGTDICHGDGNPTNNATTNLRYDDRAGNMRDSMRNGRTRKGERHWNSKLTEAHVIQIREMRSSGMKLKDIGLALGVSPSTLCSVLSGNTWGWV